MKLSPILLCRNNQWAISTPLSRQSGSETIVAKAAAYGIEGVRVDGNDVLAMYVATQRAAKRARSGGGATLLEALTYRVGAHSTSDDPSVYRDDAEVEPWRARDPIDRLRLYLTARGLWDDARDAELDAQVAAEVKATAEAVEKLALPGIETMFEDVYAQPPWHLREQLAELRDHLTTQ